MIAIVITYYNREEQLIKTIETIRQTAHADYEIIVIDDASDEPLSIDGVTYVRIEPSEKKWNDVIVPFNIGILAALKLDPDIVIIQNAECYHVGDVLTYASNHVSDGTCISFACWSLSDGETNHWEEIGKDEKRRMTGRGTGWYNHPINARYFNFCNAYSRADMVSLNGFDERFKDGIGFADNDLVRRMMEMNLKILITDESNPFVVHQFHSRSWQLDPYGSGGWIDNEALLHQIEASEARSYRAQHILTENFDEYTNYP